MNVQGLRADAKGLGDLAVGEVKSDLLRYFTFTRGKKLPACQRLLRIQFKDYSQFVLHCRQGRGLPGIVVLSNMAWLRSEGGRFFAAKPRRCDHRIAL